MSIRASTGPGRLSRRSDRSKFFTTQANESFSLAKRLDQEYTEVEVEQVLGRASGLHAVHLLGPKRNDYYPG